VPTIKVTKANIENATRHSSSHCMIAEAIRDAIPSARFISVDLQWIAFSLPEQAERHFHPTPKQAQTQLLRFDDGYPIWPFSLKLGKPVKIAASVKIQRSQVKNKGSKPWSKKAKNRTLSNFGTHREFGLRAAQP